MRPSGFSPWWDLPSWSVTVLYPVFQPMAGSALLPCSSYFGFEPLVLNLIKSFLQIENTLYQLQSLNLSALFIYIHRTFQRNLIDSLLCSSMYSPSPFSITVPINLPDRITIYLRWFAVAQITSAASPKNWCYICHLPVPWGWNDVKDELHSTVQHFILLLCFLPVLKIVSLVHCL